MKSTSSTPKLNEQFQFKTINTKVGEFEHEFVLKNLKKSSIYSITIQAINSKGAGISSEEVLAQTHENGMYFYFFFVIRFFFLIFTI